VEGLPRWAAHTRPEKLALQLVIIYFVVGVCCVTLVNSIFVAVGLLTSTRVTGPGLYFEATRSSSCQNLTNVANDWPQDLLISLANLCIWKCRLIDWIALSVIFSWINQVPWRTVAPSTANRPISVL
jgi:hypothetical protein